MKQVLRLQVAGELRWISTETTQGQLHNVPFFMAMDDLSLILICAKLKWCRKTDSLRTPITEQEKTGNPPPPVCCACMRAGGAGDSLSLPVQSLVF